MSRLRIGLVKDAVVGLTAVIPFEHLALFCSREMDFAMASDVNISLAQSTMRFISQTTRSLRTLDAESAHFVTHAFDAYGGADQRAESIRRDAGHALMCYLNRSRFMPTSRSPSRLSQWAFVVISTAPFDDETRPRKSNCWLLRCVGPEQ